MSRNQLCGNSVYADNKSFYMFRFDLRPKLMVSEILNVIWVP